MMFVSIDMDKLCFLHKHHDHETVSALSFLEAPDRSIMVENTGREEFLLRLSQLDIRMLYKNTTQQTCDGIDELVLREMLAEIVDNHMQATLALKHEVEAQVEAVEDELYKGIPWKYAIGSKKPAKAQDLFPLFGKPLAEGLAQIAAQQAPQRRAKRGAPKPKATHESPPQPPQIARARASSVRPVIWEVADRMWEEAGKPMDKAVVLELRKKMMSILETEKGVKRTSSSNELGNWMKSRLG